MLEKIVHSYIYQVNNCTTVGFILFMATWALLIAAFAVIGLIIARMWETTNDK